MLPAHLSCLPPLRAHVCSLLLVSLATLVGCGTSGITRVGGGPAIEAPRPQPATDAEVREWCEFDLESLSPDGRQRVISECRSHWSRVLGQNRSTCRNEVNEWQKTQPRTRNSAEARAMTQAREARLDQCMRNGHDFARTMRAARQFQEFKRIQQPAVYGDFIERHGRDDLIGLVAEARARYAPLCGAGVTAEATPADARGWLDRFERVGPTHCVAQQSMARRVLRREELAQAAGSAEKLDAFAAKHVADDPEGLVLRARAQALALVQQQEREALERAVTWAELVSFLERFAPAKDARYVLASVANGRIEQVRAQEIARIRATPVEELDRRLQAEASQWPPEWRDLVRERVIEQSVAAGDVPAGLRLWRLDSSADVLAVAVARMKPEDNHDEAVESEWKRSLYAAPLRDPVLAYARKRDSFSGWMLAYGISNATADLRQAGVRAGTRADKARVEYALIERIGVARFFTTSGKLNAGGKAVDINNMNLGIGHSILSQTESVLEWQVKPDSGLVPLEHGRYRVNVKLTLTLDQLVTAKILGLTNTTKDKSVLEARQSAVLEPGSSYVAQGSHRFQWTPTLQVGAIVGFSGKVETTGMSVKVEVLGVDRLDP